MGNDSSKDCIFCDIIKKNEVIVYENDEIVLFKPRSADAEIHLLCCPKKHIKNINSLTNEDIPILEKMKLTAIEYIEKEYNFKNPILGFHIPPFYSIKHLHMHCLSSKNFYNKLVLREVDDQIKRLEKF